MSLRIERTRQRRAIPHSHEFTSLRHSPTLIELDRVTALLTLSEGKNDWHDLAVRAEGTGILTGFSFDTIPCGMNLRAG